MDPETVSFEQAYQELEKTVETLERGGLSLEETLAQFERGVQLADLCERILDRAELRVRRLTQEEEGSDLGDHGDGIAF
ncbi:MAG TPA: exodeoxyribonuclease VII small subunit [Chloroflexota bacterium]